MLMRVFMRMRMRLGMFVAGIECVRGHGHDQAPMLHAFQADDDVGKVLHARRFAVDDQHFKAGVEIEMSMARGNDEVMMRMLRLGQLFSDAVGVMVVNEGDGAHNGGIWRSGRLSHQPVANQVAKGFGAIGVSTLLDGTVKALYRSESSAMPILLSSPMRISYGRRPRKCDRIAPTRAGYCCGATR